MNSNEMNGANSIEIKFSSELSELEYRSRVNKMFQEFGDTIAGLPFPTNESGQSIEVEMRRRQADLRLQEYIARHADGQVNDAVLTRARELRDLVYLGRAGCARLGARVNHEISHWLGQSADFPELAEISLAVGEHNTKLIKAIGSQFRSL